MNFTKMHGIGNDFILVEDFDNKLEDTMSELAVKACDRHFGVGADGLVLIRKSDYCDIQMVIINSDGSRPNMCGNAIRCFSRYVYDKGFVKEIEFSVETGDGKKDIELTIENNRVIGVKVFMGQESYKGKDIPLKDGLDEVFNYSTMIEEREVTLSTALMGVPHTIVIDNKEEFNTEFGRYIEKFNLFKEGTNVNFIKVIDRDNIEVRTWERGAGVTLACGTGACGSTAILNRLGLVDRDVNVTLPGGKLKILLREEGVYMIGPGEYICQGKLY